MTPSLPPAPNPDGRSPEKTGSRLVKYGGIAALVLAGGASGFGLTYLVQPSGIGSVTGITALLTVAAALLGVVLTNQHSANRQSREIQANNDSQRNQLAHDREMVQQSVLGDRDLKKIEREMSFRKEIYSNAIGAASVITQTVGKFIDPSAKLSDLTAQINAQNVHIGKVHLIAKNVTLEHVVKYSTQIVLEMMSMTPRHANLVSQDSRIKFAREHLVWVKKQQTDAKTAGLNSPVQAGMASFWAARVVEAENEIAKLESEMMLLFREGCEEVIEMGRRLSKISVSLIASIRSELDDQEFDPIAYGQMIHKMTEDLTTELTGRFDELFGVKPPGSAE